MAWSQRSAYRDGPGLCLWIGQDSSVCRHRSFFTVDLTNVLFSSFMEKDLSQVIIVELQKKNRAV